MIDDDGTATSRRVDGRVANAHRPVSANGRDWNSRSLATEGTPRRALSKTDAPKLSAPLTSDALHEVHELGASLGSRVTETKMSRMRRIVRLRSLTIIRRSNPKLVSYKASVVPGRIYTKHSYALEIVRYCPGRVRRSEKYRCWGLVHGRSRQFRVARSRLLRSPPTARSTIHGRFKG